MTCTHSTTVERLVQIFVVFGNFRKLIRNRSYAVFELYDNLEYAE